MANFATLLASIANTIKENGQGDITGDILQGVLQSIVTQVGANYQYMGVATTSTNPGTPAGSVFYLTSTAGTYTNFNNIVVDAGKLTALMWDSTAWSEAEIADLSSFGVEVVDNVITNSSTKALSAKQGKILDERTLVRYAYNPDDLTTGLSITGTIGSAVTKTSGISGRYGTNVGIPVTAGEIVRMRYDAADTAKCFVLTDSNDIVKNVYYGSQYQGRDVRMVIPSGVTKLYVTTTDKSTFYLKKNISYYDKLEQDTINAYLRSVDVVVETGAINSGTGADSTASASRRIKVNIPTNAKYVQYQTSIYTTARGCGFIVNNTWQGWQTINKETCLIPIPSGATEFRCCWVDEDYANGIDLKFAIFESGEGVNPQILKTSWYVNLDFEFGGIDSSGTDVDAGFTRTKFKCDNMKSLKFIGSTGGSTTYSYAFKVNNSWTATKLTTNPAAEVTINVPSGAEECKICWNRNITTQKDWWVLATGYIDGSTIVDSIGVSAINDIAYQFVPDFDLSHINLTDELTTDIYTESAPHDPDEIYSLFDALVTAYPNYVTKVDADTEYITASGESLPAYMSGLHTYMYKFSPTRAKGINVSDDKGSRINVMLSTIHSNEFMGLFSLARMMTHICENWKTDVNAENCRSYIDFYVFPISCVWAFVNGSRYNYNGVQINRNFPTQNWYSIDSPNTGNYSGTSAGSEYETKLMMYFANKIKPHFLMDCHTTNVDSHGDLGLIICTDTSRQLIDLAGVVGRSTTNWAIKGNSNFPDNPDYSLYSVYNEPNNSSYFGNFYQWVQQQGWGISILTEEAAYSNWENGELKTSYVEEHTPALWGQQTRFLFNCVLRFVYAMCHRLYGIEYKNELN